MVVMEGAAIEDVKEVARQGSAPWRREHTHLSVAGAQGSDRRSVILTSGRSVLYRFNRTCPDSSCFVLPARRRAVDDRQSRSMGARHARRDRAVCLSRPRCADGRYGRVRHAAMGDRAPDGDGRERVEIETARPDRPVVVPAAYGRLGWSPNAEPGTHRGTRYRFGRRRGPDRLRRLPGPIGLMQTASLPQPS